MAYSSILGADLAPIQPSGRDADLLGPSDNSDTGSDAQGTYEAHGDSDAAGTGERGSATPGEARESSDILPDRVVRFGEDGEFEEAVVTGDHLPAKDIDAQELTDLDADDADGDDT